MKFYKKKNWIDPKLPNGPKPNNSPPSPRPYKHKRGLHKIERPSSPQLDLELVLEVLKVLVRYHAGDKFPARARLYLVAAFNVDDRFGSEWFLYDRVTQAGENVPLGNWRLFDGKLAERFAVFGDGMKVGASSFIPVNSSIIGSQFSVWILIWSWSVFGLLILTVYVKWSVLCG